MKSKPGHELRLAGPLSKKVKFTKNEDAKLKYLVEKYTTKDWKLIASFLPPRTARQCRERWTNYINPELTQRPWTKEEDKVLIDLHQQIGNHWKIMEEFLPQRSKNNIKIRWNFLNRLVKNEKIIDIIENNETPRISIFNEQENVTPSSSVPNVTSEIENFEQPIPCSIQPSVSVPAIIPMAPVYVTFQPVICQVPTFSFNPNYLQEVIEPPQDQFYYPPNPPEIMYQIPGEGYIL